MEDEGVDELSTISGAHRSHREYREGARQAPASQTGDSPRDGNTGIGIQFKTNPSSGILYVTSILKDGPSQNRGIITGDIVAEVDGVDVLNRGEGQKPWPFEKVSPLIKGVPGSVVTIAFLRPASTDQEDDTAKIPVCDPERPIQGIQLGFRAVAHVFSWPVRALSISVLRF